MDYALFSFDVGGRSFVLLHLNVPDFVDSPWEALPFGRSGWEWAGTREARDKGVGRRTVVEI